MSALCLLAAAASAARSDMVTADNVSDVTNSWELVKAFGLQEAGVAFFLKIVRRAPRRR